MPQALSAKILAEAPGEAEAELGPAALGASSISRVPLRHARLVRRLSRARNCSLPGV